MVLRLVGLAIENLSEKDELVIRVHPDDHALLTSGMKDQVSRDLAAVSFSFKPDPGIEIGSCQIETQRGTVDAGFEAQLDEVYRRLLDERIDFTPAAEAASDES
jgi:flagellar assembly protein FliH